MLYSIETNGTVNGIVKIIEDNIAIDNKNGLVYPYWARTNLVLKGK